jgi:hypothetical protein
LGEAVTIAVEGGAGLPGANSYINDSFITDYFNDQRFARWNALDQPQKDTALVTASQFIDLSFKWIGKRKSIEQGLNWPRVEAYWPNTETLIAGIPLPVKKAAAEAVWILIEQGDAGGSLFPIIEDAQVKREKLGALEQEYFEKKTTGTGSTDATVYGILNLLLTGLYGKPAASDGVQIAPVVRV